MPFRFRTAAAAAALALSLACDSGTGDTTSLSVMLKDAPGDFHSAVVTISEVSLVGSGGVTVLSETPTTADLLTLANTATDLVTDFVVPSGSYQQLRIKVSGAYIEVENEDGSTSIYATPGYDQVPAGATVAGELQTPSFAQSGIKVNMADGSLDLSGDQHILLIDFDVEQSFGHEAGDRWVMHPVITGGELGFTGGLRVTVQNGDGVVFDLATATATLTDEADVAIGAPLPLTDGNADGVFEAQFALVTPGNYKVLISVPAPAVLTTNPASPHAVTVSSGQETTAAFVVTAVQ